MPTVDPNEAPEGYVAVEDVNTFGCNVCQRNYDWEESCETSVDCGPSERKDGCNVIYLLSKEGAAV